MGRLFNSRRRSLLPDGAIAQGGHRVVVSGNGPSSGTILKVEHAKREGRFFGFPTRVSMRWHTFLRWGKSSNKVEWDHYHRFFNRVPTFLRENFAHISKLEGPNGKILRMDAVRDANGTISKSLAETGPIQNKLFWEKLDSMVDWMRQNNIHHFGLKAENILVKHKSNGSFVPVLIDYKDMDARRYFFYPWLHIESFARAKMMRRVKRMKEKYALE